jgi:hypothetical protein
MALLVDVDDDFSDILPRTWTAHIRVIIGNLFQLCVQKPLLLSTFKLRYGSTPNTGEEVNKKRG